MDHKEMVRRAEKWLLNTRRCGFVLTEFAPWIYSEIPDAIGWDNRKGRSYLIECKTSRADFLGDAEKPFRKRPRRGMGNYRYYSDRDGVRLAKDHNAVRHESGTLHFQFSGRDGMRKVYVADAETRRRMEELARSLKLKGVALWRLGFEE